MLLKRKPCNRFEFFLAVLFRVSSRSRSHDSSQQS